MLMHALVAGGADIIELGIPFSDPMADGPVIQRSSEVALSKGMSLSKVLDAVSEFRKSNSHTPIVLMGYANPVEAMGYKAFAERAAAVGVDGVLSVDLPPEEAAEFVAILKAKAIAPIFLVSPTTPASRLKVIGEMAEGYVYYVSLKGVTGSANLDTDAVKLRLAALRQHISVPIGVGFGIRDEASAKAIANFADAVVIGSRMIEEIEANPADPATGLQAFTGRIRDAVHQARS